MISLMFSKSAKTQIMRIYINREAPNKNVVGVVEMVSVLDWLKNDQ